MKRSIRAGSVPMATNGYHQHHSVVMLDLKSKLAAAGLVTQKDVERVEKSKGKSGKKRRGGRGRSGGKGSGATRLAVAELRGKSKGERYDAVRKFIGRVRLDDPTRPPTEEAATFHFPTAKGQIGRLVLEPDVHGWLKDGGAGIVAYMSNHGLAHAPVPAAAARDLAELFPLWLRVLKGHEGAGRIEVDPPAPTDEGPSPATARSEPSEPSSEPS